LRARNTPVSTLASIPLALKATPDDAVGPNQIIRRGTDMRTQRTHQARYGALVIGAVAALAACSPSGDSANAGGESGAASTAMTDTGAMGAGAAAATAGAGDSAMGGANAAGGAMGDVGIAGTINTSNAAEIGTSELAQERAASSDVKSFANDMIKEHRAMQKEADQIAQKNNMAPQPGGQADQMQQMMTATVDSLKTLKGAQFDQRYMAFQVQSHQTTLDALRRFETQAQNADLKAMITKAIPAVQGHLERAQKIQSGLGGANTATKS
jgi:putative membrane protein